MRRIRTLRRRYDTRADIRGQTCTGGVEIEKSLPRVFLVGQHGDRYGVKVRIAHVLRPVGIGSALGLDHVMDRLGATEAHGAEIVGFQRVEHLHEQHPAGRGRRHGDDLVAAIAPEDGFAPNTPVLGEIFMADQSTAFAHLGDDEISRLARIKARAAIAPNTLERVTEIRLAKNLSGTVGIAILVGERFDATRILGKSWLRTRQRPSKVARHHESPTRQVDRRLDDIFAAERAVLFEY